MSCRFQHSPVLFLLVGFLAGIMFTRRPQEDGSKATSIWPEIPIHAGTTDRCKTYAIATGKVNEEVEAVYLLDLVTGELTGFVIGSGRMGFQTVYRRNVLPDFQLDPAKNPQFMMVTGLVNIKPGEGVQKHAVRADKGKQEKGNQEHLTKPSVAAVYVAETTTGSVWAYVIPWEVGLREKMEVVSGRIEAVGKASFRNVNGPEPLRG